MEHTEGELSPPLSDSQVAENALIDIKIALDHVHLFQEQYVSFDSFSHFLISEFSTKKI